jgi:hypothetical protein
MSFVKTSTMTYFAWGRKWISTLTSLISWPIWVNSICRRYAQNAIEQLGFMNILLIEHCVLFNLLTGSFPGSWCNLPWVFKCTLFRFSIKQEEWCKHNGGFSQYVMKTDVKMKCSFIHNSCYFYFIIIIFFRFLIFYLFCSVENMVLHIGPSHSQDSLMMTISSFHWPSRLNIFW